MILKSMCTQKAQKKNLFAIFQNFDFRGPIFFLCLLCAPHCLTRTHMRRLDMYLKSYQKRFLIYGFKKIAEGGVLREARQGRRPRRSLGTWVLYFAKCGLKKGVGPSVGPSIKSDTIPYRDSPNFWDFPTFFGICRLFFWKIFFYDTAIHVSGNPRK